MENVTLSKREKNMICVVLSTSHKRAEAILRSGSNSALKILRD